MEIATWLVCRDIQPEAVILVCLCIDKKYLELSNKFVTLFYLLLSFA